MMIVMQILSQWQCEHRYRVYSKDGQSHEEVAKQKYLTVKALGENKKVTLKI